MKTELDYYPATLFKMTSITIGGLPEANRFAGCHVLNAGCKKQS